jgi:transposase InsO family protein
LGLSPRTLRAWQHDAQSAAGEPQLRGRPPLACAPETSQPILEFLAHVTGPCIGLPALQVLFPTVRRVLLEELLRRFRRVWRWQHTEEGYRLTWCQPGRVWAIDFVELEFPIDGLFPYLLSIRDLASGYQLAWRAMRGAAAHDVWPVLCELFAEHGPPLVLKSDNGSAFIAEELGQALLQEHVAQLFSPPRYPQYNGSLERANGVLQTYTRQHALRAGHPFRWTTADLEHARQLANTVSRPWGHRGLSPEQAWEQRRPIEAVERAAFQAAWEAQRLRAARELGLDLGR